MTADAKQSGKISKLRLFLENLFVYGLVGALYKVIPLIMVPIITRLLADPSEYGIVDIYSTITSFGMALAGLGMFDTAFRFFFDKEDADYQKRVCSTTAFITLSAAIVVIVCFYIFQAPLSKIFFSSAEYGYLVVWAGVNVFFSIVSGFYSWPIRFQNRRKVFIVTQLSSSVFMYGSATILLLCGVTVDAIPLGCIIMAVVYTFIYYFINRSWFKVRSIDKTLIRSFLRFGLPLVPSAIVYWVFHSMDRIMIANMIGTDWNGLYAAGSKLAMISYLVYLAFDGGWQYFTFKTMNDAGQVETTSKIFDWLAAVSVAALAICMMVYQPLFQVLFEGPYRGGSVVFPHLFLSPLVLVLFKVVGNQLFIIKKTMLNTVSLALGAVVNVVLNYVFIQIYGIKGCALATLLGYFVALVVIIVIVHKKKLITFNWRIVACPLSCVLMLTFAFINDKPSIWASVAVLAVLVLLYFKDVKMMFQALKQLKAKKG